MCVKEVLERETGIESYPSFVISRNGSQNFPLFVCLRDDSASMAPIWPPVVRGNVTFPKICAFSFTLSSRVPVFTFRLLFRREYPGLMSEVTTKSTVLLSAADPQGEPHENQTFASPHDRPRPAFRRACRSSSPACVGARRRACAAAGRASGRTMPDLQANSATHQLVAALRGSGSR